MRKFKFELNSAGVREMLRSGEMMDVCEDYAKQVQHNAGDGYSVHRGVNRVNVSAETDAATAANYSSNTLLKAVGQTSGGHNVREHTRRLKDGRVITVRAHTRSR